MLVDQQRGDQRDAHVQDRGERLLDRRQRQKQGDHAHAAADADHDHSEEVASSADFGTARHKNAKH